MNDLLIYKNPYIFDRLMELGVDYTDALSMYQVGFLGYTGSGINRIDPGVFRISKSSTIPNGVITKSFSEIMFDRAKELTKKYSSFKIRWTGLSSAIIIKTLLNFTNRIEIITDAENKKYIPSEFIFLKTNLFDKSYFTIIDTDDVFISDNCRFSLFNINTDGWKVGNYVSPIKNFKLSVNLKYETKNIMILGKKYADCYPECIAINEYYLDPSKAYKNIYNYFEKLIEQSPIKIKTNFDLYWWIRFCMQWNANKWQYLGLTGKNVNTVDFFDYDGFQLWSIENHYTKGRHTMIDFLGYDIPILDTSLMNLVNLNGRKTTWKISFADSDGNFATEPIPVTKEMVRKVIK